jgi:hypothetical protein
MKGFRFYEELSDKNKAAEISNGNAIDIYTLQDGTFLACHNLANANDIVECLTGSEYQFTQVGYTGIWLADKQALDYLAKIHPKLFEQLDS